MGPRVKFNVDPKASEMLDKQLISNDLGKLERIQWMVFKLGDESWDLMDYGKVSDDFFKKILNLCPKNEGRQIIFRSKDSRYDVWIKYIPDEASVRERTYFATASDSLFDDTRGCKIKLEFRTLEELSEDNPAIEKYLH